MKEDALKALAIGEVARRAGVGVETVRFYERRGLVSAPPRRRPASQNQPGRRQYPPETVGCIRFIQRAKGLGFSLREIAELLALRVEPDGKCAEVRRRAAAKIEDIDERIRDLSRMRTALVRLVAGCPESAPLSQCPILSALDKEEDERCLKSS